MNISDVLSSMSNIFYVVFAVIALVSLIMVFRVKNRQGKLAKVYESIYSERATTVLQELRRLVRDIADCFENRKVYSLQYIMQEIKREITEPPNVRAALGQLETASNILATWFSYYFSHLRRSNDVEALLDETGAFMRSFDHLIKYELKPLVESSPGLPTHTVDRYEDLRTKYNIFKEGMESLTRTATEKLGREFSHYFEFLPELKKKDARE